MRAEAFEETSEWSAGAERDPTGRCRGGKRRAAPAARLTRVARLTRLTRVARVARLTPLAGRAVATIRTTRASRSSARAVLFIGLSIALIGGRAAASSGARSTPSQTTPSQTTPSPTTGAPSRRADTPVDPVDERPTFTTRELRRIRRLAPLGPPPPDPTNRVADDARAAALGRFLFFDARLSSNGEVSCATCHRPDYAFSEPQPLPRTLGLGARRTPTLLNAAYQRWFFWDGRADTLWSQALGPIENPVEMGGDRSAVAHRVAEDATLREAYEALFGTLPELADGERFPAHARPGDDAGEAGAAWRAMRAEDRAAIDHVFANVAKAIAAYERRLVSRDSAFDRFVESLELDADGHARGDALSPAAQRGLKLFVGRGQCHTCHAGPELTDREFHNTSAPPLNGGELRDPGRFDGSRFVRASEFNAAGPHSDDPDGVAAQRVRHLRVDSESWGEFKTPTLRSVLGRGPFMHQGQFEDLDAVLEFYSTLEGAAGRNHHAEQILTPVRLTPEEAADLRAFLASLAGAPLPAELLAPPASPRLSETAR